MLEFKKGMKDQGESEAASAVSNDIKSFKSLDYDSFLKVYNENPDDKSTGWK